MKLKPIEEQVMVITGASSGMGLVTARRAAKRGARLVLVARAEEELKDLVDELRGQGREAVAVAADVTNEEDVKRIAATAVERFGGFDTWANLAGLTIYGSLDEVKPEDHRRLFDINYWGVFNGSMTAAKYLREKGGAIINMGSILSDMPVPFQGTYCASKHAVKAFTSTLRMELHREGAPISVSIIKPSSIDTPLRHHGKNYMSRMPQNPPPAYVPELAAEAILYCAEHPRREIVIGGGGRLNTFLYNLAPGAAERTMRKIMARLETTRERARPRDENSLYSPEPDGKETGGTSPVFKHSVYTQAMLHPVATTVATTAVLGATAAALAWGTRRRRNRRRLASALKAKIPDAHLPRWKGGR